MWKQDFTSSRKIWVTLLKLNPDNKEAKKGFEELQRREQAVKSGETTLTIEYEDTDDDSSAHEKK
jgi:hypothetical protein